MKNRRGGVCRRRKGKGFSGVSPKSAPDELHSCEMRTPSLYQFLVSLDTTSPHTDLALITPILSLLVEPNGPYNTSRTRSSRPVVRDGLAGLTTRGFRVWPCPLSAPQSALLFREYPRQFRTSARLFWVVRLCARGASSTAVAGG